MAHTNVSFEVFPEGGPVDKIDAVLQDTKSKRGILGVLPKNLSVCIILIIFLLHRDEEN